MSVKGQSEAIDGRAFFKEERDYWDCAGSLVQALVLGSAENWRERGVCGVVIVGL